MMISSINFLLIIDVLVVVMVVMSGQSLCAKRPYVNNNHELELTKKVIINPKHCKTSHDMVVIIHSAGQSTGKYFDVRQELRSGWVGAVKRHNISVWFALALNKNQTVNEELMIESNKYNDIIQFGFVDHYYNLTLKAIATQRWLHRYCSSVKYLLKIDDDSFVNIDLLLKVLPDFDMGFNGLIRFVDLVLHREMDFKWHVPRQYYPNNYYPDYPLSTYVANNVNKDQLLRSLDSYKSIAGHYVLDIDDAFVTGILANWSGISRHNSSHFVLDNCKCKCSLHTVPIHLECKNRTNTWHDFLDASINTNAYCNQTLSPINVHQDL
ncbi:beta-1,3-galactosyltransferase 1-like [Oppia nitens]|uniref:beta-1,3-galactosyltransferase 1-like n=1 Tax=Oppia nitens TaxID=1686743 RepID=UPI0023DA08FA|nr:beta-1,3-galactosyltransferase 1-like [Oppia nitens]